MNDIIRKLKQEIAFKIGAKPTELELLFINEYSKDIKKISHQRYNDRVGEYFTRSPTIYIERVNFSII